MVDKRILYLVFNADAVIQDEKTEKEVIKLRATFSTIEQSLKSDGDKEIARKDKKLYEWGEELSKQDKEIAELKAELAKAKELKDQIIAVLTCPNDMSIKEGRRKIWRLVGLPMTDNKNCANERSE